MALLYLCRVPRVGRKTAVVNVVVVGDRRSKGRLVGVVVVVAFVGLLFGRGLRLCLTGLMLRLMMRRMLLLLLLL